MNKKLLSNMLFLILLIGSFALAGTISLETVQATTEVGGILTSDTTWTEASGPYNLTGNVLVNEGVTLTVDAGVIVNLNSYYLAVNGTLQAKGTSNSPVIFNDGIKDYDVLRFNSLNDYNDVTGSGNILDHTYFSGGIGISNGSGPKIVNSNLAAVSVWHGGSPIISNNQFTSGVYIFGADGSCVITYNSIIGHGVYVENSGVKATIANNNIEAKNGGYGISTEGDVVITGNNISNGISASGTFQAIYNDINGGISISAASGTISNNSIKNATDGVKITPSYFRPSNILIQDNVISDCSTGINDVGASSITLRQTIGSQGTVNIQRNLIKNNDYGIVCSSDDNMTIEYNTIVGNSVGVSAPGTSTTIAYNNIQDNNINMKAATANADAKNNWWGTTDAQSISQSIYDFEEDFNLGKVTFTPFLAYPDPSASPDPNAPIPTPPAQTPSTSPTPTPTSSPSPTPYSGAKLTEEEIIIGVAITAVVIGAGIALLIYLIKRK